LAVDILVTEHFGKTIENNENMSLFISSALHTSVIHWCVQGLKTVKSHRRN